MTLIYQITDTHISPEDSPANAHFEILMTYVRDHPADHLVISGDLPGVDGSAEIYEWMRSRLPPGQDVIVIPGNHDDPSALYTVFGESVCRNREFLHHIELEKIDVVFTNSGSGEFPAHHFTYLTEASIREGSILFTHYPTRRVSEGFMDTTWPLRRIEQTDESLSGSVIAHVFCGHYHTALDVPGHYHLHITPSPAFEVDLHAVDPVFLPARIPLRRIRISGSQVSTDVLYLD